MLEVSDISKTLSGKPIFDEVSLSVKQGELTAITGPSGSGKTTLLSCIIGTIQPDSGTISLSGKTYSRFPEKDRRNFRLKNIGVVDQGNRLIEDLTCRDNIRLIAEMSQGGRRKSLATAREILKQLNMEAYEDRYPSLLSGGERQRISIGCALANRPSLIAADEPTSSLDDEAAGVVMDLFLKFAQQFEVPVVMVTHDARVTKYASAIYQIGGSRVSR
ncbi:ABC transporter ATP-binding protein [Corynebacterium sp. MC3]|uniref:ABC transporter ATP-binding protein n=1 Tax=Corynebacterium sp. MC3 TaxID=1720193 RepID=UPI0008D998B0|nr:ABC transporter ATP-binding protein [Corynebacterium sp. MC3]